jgi:hypothetical protein
MGWSRFLFPRPASRNRCLESPWGIYLHTEFAFMPHACLEGGPYPSKQIRLAASPSVLRSRPWLGHVPFQRPSRRFPTFGLRRRQCVPPRLKTPEPEWDDSTTTSIVKRTTHCMQVAHEIGQTHFPRRTSLDETFYAREIVLAFRSLSSTPARSVRVHALVATAYHR